jgi:hypothetical protein
MMVVTYEPDGDASTAGLAGVLSGLDPDSVTRDEVAEVVFKRSIVRALYILSDGGAKIRETLVNSVRLFTGEWRTAPSSTACACSLVSGGLPGPAASA